LDTSNVEQIAAAAKPLFEQIRNGNCPQALVLHTVRFGPHSKGDDTRDETELARLRAARDPLEILGDRLKNGERASIDADVQDEVASAFAQAQKDPEHSA
jgi:TPP-dependent pyruvate/acetoin dehydrogenase alpha subunit